MVKDFDQLLVQRPPEHVPDINFDLKDKFTPVDSGTSQKRAETLSSVIYCFENYTVLATQNDTLDSLSAFNIRIFLPHKVSSFLNHAKQKAFTSISSPLGSQEIPTYPFSSFLYSMFKASTFRLIKYDLCTQ